MKDFLPLVYAETGEVKIFKDRQKKEFIENSIIACVIISLGIVAAILF
jgi:hypothetical protein